MKALSISVKHFMARFSCSQNVECWFLGKPLVGKCMSMKMGGRERERERERGIERARKNRRKNKMKQKKEEKKKKNL